MKNTHWLDKVSDLAMPLSASDDSRTLQFTALYIVHNTVVLNLRYLRTLVRACVERVTTHEHCQLPLHGWYKTIYPTVSWETAALKFFTNSS